MVKIRLKRMGTTKRPFYRLVVADSRSPRDGRFIEALGFYDPLPQPAAVKIDADRVREWLRRGARPSDSARDLLVAQGILAGNGRRERGPADEPERGAAEAAPEAAKAAPDAKPEVEAQPAVDAEPVLDVEAAAEVEPGVEAPPTVAAAARSDAGASGEAGDAPGEPEDAAAPAEETVPASEEA